MALPLAAADWGAVAADVLVFVGLLVVTLGVYGLFRMPDVYTQLHATGKAVFLGIIALLVASLATREAEIAARALLIAAFLVLTTPVGAHVIARSAYRRGEGMKSPDSVDESGSGLNAPGTPTPAEEMTEAEAASAHARED